MDDERSSTMHRREQRRWGRIIAALVAAGAASVPWTIEAEMELAPPPQADFEQARPELEQAPPADTEMAQPELAPPSRADYERSSPDIAAPPPADQKVRPGGRWRRPRIAGRRVAVLALGARPAASRRMARGRPVVAPSSPPFRSPTPPSATARARLRRGENREGHRDRHGEQAGRRNDHDRGQPLRSRSRPTAART